MDDYNLPIGGDISKLLTDLTSVKSSLSDANDAAKKTTQTIKDGFSDAAKATENANKSLLQSATAYKQTTRSLAELTDALRYYKDQAFSERDLAKLKIYNTEIEKLEKNVSQSTNVGKKGFDELGNAVQKNTNYLGKAFSGLRTVANILPGIGVAGILAFATGPIIEYISQLDIFKNRTSQATLNLEALNSVNESANKNAGKEISNLKILYAAANDVNNSIADRIKAARELQEEFPETFANSTTLAIINGQEKKSYDDLSASIIDNARARAAANKIAEISGKILDVEDTKRKIRNADANNIAANQENLRQAAIQNMGLTGKAVEEEVKRTSKFFEDQVNLNQKTQLAAQDRISKGYQGTIKFLEGYVGGVNKLSKALSAATAGKDAEAAANKAEADRKKAEAKLENERKQAEQKRLARIKQVSTEELKLQNEITQALGQQSSDKTKKEIDQENARFKVALDNLNKEKKDFPELQSLVDKAIEAQRIAHIGRLAAIDKKQQEEQAKILSDGQKAISSVLKKDNDEQIEAVNQRYVEIRAKAKAAGLLTAEVEKKLAEQQTKDVSDVTLKLQNEAAQKAQDIAIANVQSRQQRVGETDKEYELKNQKAILGIKIDFAEAALKLIDTNPEKSKEVAQIRANIAELKKQLKGINSSLNDEQSFSFTKYFKKAFGATDEDFAEIEKGAAAVVSLFNNVTNSILAGYQKQIDANDNRISELKNQEDQAQSFLDDQLDLKEKGYANDSDAAQRNVDAIKDSLAQEEKARQDNIKRQQEAQKVVAAIRSAEIAANTVEQVSNLATAASKIFKAHAGIPFVGVIIALAAVAALVAGFVAIKASIKSATTDTTKFKKGGKLKGKLHDDGGNKYQSIDGNDTIELERDEYVINRKATAKHEKLIEAINKDDFSSLKFSDYSIQELLKGTGVANHSDIARNVGRETVYKQDNIKAPIVIVASPEDPHSSKIEGHLQTLVNLELKKPDVFDYGDYIEVHYKDKKGNITLKEKTWKKK